MIGFLSTKERKIYLPNKEVKLTEDEYNNASLFQNQYPDIKLWLTDAVKNHELPRQTATHCAKPMTISEWDEFGLINESYQDVVQAFADLPYFIPAIKDFQGGQGVKWEFDIQPLVAEMPKDVTYNFTTNKDLAYQIDYIEFLLWLMQKQVLLPKGKPTEKKMKLKELLSDNTLNLGLYIKKEAIQTKFRHFLDIKNKHWDGNWICSAWLPFALFEGLDEKFLEYEYDVLTFETTEGILPILPENFDLSWLFCPAAHFTLKKFFTLFQGETKRNPVALQMYCYLIGAFLNHKTQNINKHNLIIEFTMTHWTTRTEKKKAQYTDRYTMNK